MTELLLSSLRLSVPLVFAAMGGLLCEKSGVASLCIEGVILVSAFFSGAVAAVTSDPFLGLLSGLMAGAIFMWLH